MNGRAKHTKITLRLRADGAFWTCAAMVDDHTFVAQNFTTGVGAKVSALGLVAAYFAGEVQEKLNKVNQT